MIDDLLAMRREAIENNINLGNAEWRMSEELRDQLLGDSVYHCYLEYDPILRVHKVLGFPIRAYPRDYTKPELHIVEQHTEVLDKWDERFLDLAKLVASWSKDPSTKVGAVIADAKHRVFSLGFNGPPRQVADDETDRDEKLRRTIHAEQNAILFANAPVEGCTIYTTFPPCARCTAFLIQSGIQRIVTRKPTTEQAERWGDEFTSAATLRKHAGVEYVEAL